MGSFTKMLFVIITLLVAVRMVPSQPVPCIEDSQCPDNFFCEDLTHVCRMCLDCRELNRILPPNLKEPKICVKTDEDCGPCFEGWRPRSMYYGTKCEPAAAKRVQFISKEIFIWCTGAGAVAGILITVLFLHVFQRTSIFKVVNCYIPIPLTGVEQWKGIEKSSSLLYNPKPSTKEESCLNPQKNPYI